MTGCNGIPPGGFAGVVLVAALIPLTIYQLMVWSNRKSTLKSREPKHRHEWKIIWKIWWDTFEGEAIPKKNDKYLLCKCGAMERIRSYSVEVSDEEKASILRRLRDMGDCYLLLAPDGDGGRMPTDDDIIRVFGHTGNNVGIPTKVNNKQETKNIVADTIRTQKGGKMFKEMKGAVSGWVNENKNMIVWIAVLFLADHFLFEGKFKKRLQGVVESILGKIEKGIDPNKPLPIKEAK